jgi:hypothetical protein
VPEIVQFIAHAWQATGPPPKVRHRSDFVVSRETIEDGNMGKQAETTFFCAATLSALALAAVIAVQEFALEPAPETLTRAPIVKLETQTEVGASRRDSRAHSPRRRASFGSILPSRRSIAGRWSERIRDDRASPLRVADDRHAAYTGYIHRRHHDGATELFGPRSVSSTLSTVT